MDEQNEQNQPEPVQLPPGEYQSPPSVPPSNTDALILWGFVLAGIGLFCCCCTPVFAIPSIILGAIAYSRGDQRGLWVIIAGVVALLGGITLSSISAPFSHRWMPNLPGNFPGPWRRI